MVMMMMMMIDSLGDGAGNTLWTERDPARVNIKSVLPRLPRNLDDVHLNLPRFQPLQRFLDRTKLSNERVLTCHPRSHLRHLFIHNQIRVSATWPFGPH